MRPWTDFKFPRRRKLLRKLIRIGAIVVAAVGGLVASVLVEEKQYYLAILPTALIGLAAWAEFVAGEFLVNAVFPDSTAETFNRLEERARRSPRNFITAIQSKLRDSVGQLQACDRDRIRSAVHLVVDVLPAEGLPDSRALVQLTEYVGVSGVLETSGNPARGRMLPISQGVIGRCVRSMEPEAVNFATESEYRRRMVAEFGFTEGSAAAKKIGARSYLAVPIVDRAQEPTVRGVVYFDTSESQVFPVAAKSLRLEALADEIFGYLASAEIV